MMRPRGTNASVIPPRDYGRSPGRSKARRALHLDAATAKIDQDTRRPATIDRARGNPAHGNIHAASTSSSGTASALVVVAAPALLAFLASVPAAVVAVRGAEPAASGSPAPTYINTGFENASPLQWEIGADGAVHVRLLYDYQRNAPNRAAGHWHFQLQGKPGADLTVILHNFDNIYNGRPGAAVSAQTICYVSADGKRWKVVPGEFLPGNLLKMRVRLDGPSLYLARLEPYRLADLDRFLREIRGHRAIQIECIGTTVEGRPLEIVPRGRSERAVSRIAPRGPTPGRAAAIGSCKGWCVRCSPTRRPRARVWRVLRLCLADGQ